MTRALHAPVAVLAALATAAAASPAAAQPVRADSSFRWSAPAAPGARLVIRSLQGRVRVESADVDAIEVRAIKRWRTGDARAVTVAVSRHGPRDRDVLVCGHWEGITLACSEGGYPLNNDGSNDTRLDFLVTVPRHMHVVAEAINDSVIVTGVDGNVHGSTVNGSVTVAVRPDADADVVVSTLNGSFESELTLAGASRVRRRGTTRAVLGAGGRTISFASVNGALRLVRQ